MGFIWDMVTEWLKGVLVSGILDNLTGLFGNMNQQIAEISTQVGATPMDWNSRIHDTIRNLSQSVILPIAGGILAFVMTLELIQIVMEKNNMHESVCYKGCYANTTLKHRQSAHLRHRWYGGAEMEVIVG